MNYPEVYGIAGKRGHGKDTLAKAIQKQNDKFQIIHFAAPLKTLCMKVFGLTHDQVWTEKGKEEHFTNYIRLDDHLQDLKTATGLDILPRYLEARSPREVLQFVGTDYIRTIKESYWVDQVHEKIKLLGGYVLIPDTRFDNETTFLQSIGAQIIKVKRVGKDDKDQASQHASETSIDKIEADWQVEVPEGQLEVIDDFAKILAAGQLPQFKHEGHAKNQLKKIVEGFNQSFHLWEENWKVGANVGVDYHTNPGKKSFYVMDVATALYKKPVESALASAGAIIQESMKTGEFDKILERMRVDHQAHPTG